MKEQASTIQVTFLLDATFSMDRWFPVAENAVKSIMQGVRDRVRDTEIEPKVEVAVNFYRDREDGRLAFEANPFGGEADALKLLSRQKPLGGGQPYEMVFGGVCKTLEQTPFKPAAVKILIVIGDDGNDPKDAQFSLEKVCKNLVDAGGATPIGFFAIAVGKKESDARRTFISQMREITRRLTNSQLEVFRAAGVSSLDEQSLAALRTLTGQVKVTDDPKEVVEAIRNRFELAMAEMRFRRKQLNDLKGGAVDVDDVPNLVASNDAKPPAADENLGVYGVVWQQQMMELVKREGLEPLQLARQGVQLFHEGWVAERDPYESALANGDVPMQVRHVALIHKSELRRLSVVLEVALKQWRPEALDRTWSDALAEIVGERPQVLRSKTPAELIKMHVHGIKSKSGLLALTFDELSRVSAAQISELRTELDLKNRRIRDLLDELRASYKPESRVVGGVRHVEFTRKPLGKAPVWWGDGDLRAWIDRDVLP